MDHVIRLISECRYMAFAHAHSHTVAHPKFVYVLTSVNDDDIIYSFDFHLSDYYSESHCEDNSKLGFI